MDAARRAKLLVKLEEAEDALHSTALGGNARVFVDQNGERIEYGPTNVTALNKYIFQLKLSLGIANSGPMTTWML
jgi:hypothetical protein